MPGGGWRVGRRGIKSRRSCRKENAVPTEAATSPSRLSGRRRRGKARAGVAHGGLRQKEEPKRGGPRRAITIASETLPGSEIDFSRKPGSQESEGWRMADVGRAASVTEAMNLKNGVETTDFQTVASLGTRMCRDSQSEMQFRAFTRQVKKFGVIYFHDVFVSVLFV